MKLKELIIKTAAVDWEKLVPFQPEELKDISEKEMEKLKRSLVKNGFSTPFSVWQSGKKIYILDGHHRYKALLLLKEDGVDIPQKLKCNFLDVKTNKQAKKLILVFNSHYATMQRSEFMNFVKGLDLKDLAHDIKIPSVNVEQWLNIMMGNEDYLVQVTPVKQAKPKGKLGDLYELKSKYCNHRIICGSCGDKAVVNKLMGKNKIHLLFTSPPYADLREYNIGKFDWLEVMNNFTDVAVKVMQKNSNIIVNLGIVNRDRKLQRYWDPWLQHCEEKLNLNLSGWYVWDKLSPTPRNNNGLLILAHEWLFHFILGKVKANYIKDKLPSSSKKRKFIQRRHDNTIKTAQASNRESKVPNSVVPITCAKGNKENHPAVFPVELPAFGIDVWTQRGDNVYDPFTGSGSTLIACEQRSRNFFGTDIDPIYMDIIIQRWVNYTGIEKIKKNGKVITWKVKK